MKYSEEGARELQRDYKLAFGSPAGASVLHDLAQFCCAYHTSYSESTERKIFINEGRRQVFLRIQNLMQMSEQELLDAYRGRYTIREVENA